jgi:hypothetical protein
MGSGGWRWNAGRPAYKGKAEACQRLDVRQLAKWGKLSGATGGSYSWHIVQTGEPSGSIGYSYRDDVLTLDYTLNGDPRKQRVPVIRTPCNYGGARAWFACPHCLKRVALLYLRRGGFYCRKCAQVAYYSQSEDVCGRAWRKQQKAEAKLGKNWARPKGMHAATRERLLETIFACEERRDDELARFMALHGLLLESL